MGPVRQKPIQRPVRSVHMCVHCTQLIVARNIAQNRPDNFPSYPPDNHYCSDDVYLREGGVYWSVCHNCEPCKNGWTDQDAVWDMDSGGSNRPRKHVL